MKKSVAVIGQGFVGGSLTTVLAERGVHVRVHDKLGKVAQGGFDPLPRLRREYEPLTLIGSMPDPPSNEEILAARTIEKFVIQCESEPSFAKVYFVCLPTPMCEDGSADLSIVEGVLEQLANVEGPRIAVVKSTVPPGTTNRWNRQFNDRGLYVVFCPEFLTEANALEDMRNQTRIIIGGPRPWVNSVKLIFQQTFPKVPLVKTSSTTAEMVKYMTNCFLATKVSFANEMYQICEALDEEGHNIDYDKVVEYSKLDPRLGNSHWAVPGPVPTHDGRHVGGFGGHCFPKDLNALRVVAEQLKVKPTVLNAVWEKNLEVRGPEDRDWEKMEGRAVSKKKG